MNKIGIIVQCRLNSTRLKNKLLLKIGKITLLELLLRRLKQVKNVELICALASEKNNFKLKNIIKKNNVDYFIGSNSNVLKRYYDIASKRKLKTIIRITSDCPLIDPYLVEKGIKVFKNKKIDYLSNNLTQTWPQGLDFEIFTYNSLKKTFLHAKNSSQKEHVTEFIRQNNSFKKFNLKNNVKLNRYFRWTIDTKIDYKFFIELYKYYPSIMSNFKWFDLYKFLNKNYNIQKINATSHHFYFKN
tara:strand:+ start:1780 stop:2511 length:732 start_codon:yes stop_codon:yes gene_type:complete